MGILTDLIKYLKNITFPKKLDKMRDSACVTDTNVVIMCSFLESGSSPFCRKLLRFYEEEFNILNFYEEELNKKPNRPLLRGGPA